MKEMFGFIKAAFIFAMALGAVTAAYADIDACKDEMGHQGTGKTINGMNNQSVYGNVGSSPYHYEIWYQGGNNSMTYYDNGTYKASWSGTSDFLARVGLKYDEKQTYEQVGPIDAYFNWKKSGSGGGYNFIGIYGWTVDPLVEFYIVDDWFNKPGTDLTGQSKGEITVDDGTYEISQKPRYNAPSIKGEASFPQYFSVRRSARSCGHIDVTAHFKKWESLGMKMGKMYEAKLLVEASGGSGYVDVTYFKMTDKEHPLSVPESSTSEEKSSSSESIKSSSSEKSTESSSSKKVESSSSKKSKSSSSRSRRSSSDNEESSSSEVYESSSSSEKVHTTPLLANIHFTNTDRNLQIFNMQGRFLGTLLVTKNTDVRAAVKSHVQRAGLYIIKHDTFIQKIFVK